MAENNNITIRKALLEDEKDFADLIVVSAPYFPGLFGKEVRTIAQRLFRQCRNLFDFLGKVPVLMKFNKAVGMMNDGECYISNVATYSQHRGIGVGTRLILKMEEEIRKKDTERIALDVEKGNISAIRLYKKLGYQMIKDFSIQLHKDKTLCFYRMLKKLRY